MNQEPVLVHKRTSIFELKFLQCIISSFTLHIYFENPRTKTTGSDSSQFSERKNHQKKKNKFFYSLLSCIEAQLIKGLKA